MSLDCRSSLKRRVKLPAKFNGHVVTSVIRLKVNSVKIENNKEIMTELIDSIGEMIGDNGGIEDGVLGNMTSSKKNDEISNVSVHENNIVVIDGSTLQHLPFFPAIKPGYLGRLVARDTFP
nr:hypothetical protein [Tanacetum cinerariifolium]